MLCVDQLMKRKVTILEIQITTTIWCYGNIFLIYFNLTALVWGGTAAVKWRATGRKLFNSPEGCSFEAAGKSRGLDELRALPVSPGCMRPQMKAPLSASGSRWRWRMSEKHQHCSGPAPHRSVQEQTQIRNVLSTGCAWTAVESKNVN